MTIDKMIDMLAQLRNRVGGEANIEFGLAHANASNLFYDQIQLRENVETGIHSVVVCVKYK